MATLFPAPVVPVDVDVAHVVDDRGVVDGVVHDRRVARRAPDFPVHDAASPVVHVRVADRAAVPDEPARLADRLRARHARAHG